MSTLLHDSAGELESWMGSPGSLERPLGGTLDESSNDLPDIFNIQPEAIGEPPRKSSSKLWRCRRPSTNAEFECRFPARGPNTTVPDAVAYASFGDGDTTASVTSFGQITQITRYLGVGTSGFFSVDQPSVPEPLYVEDRARKLMELSAVGCGIDFSFGQVIPAWLRQVFRQKPMLEFVRDRWPRFTTQTADSTTTTQFFVHESTVFSTWTCQSKRRCLPMTEFISFRADQLIRELEFINSQHTFNTASKHNTKTYRSILGHDEESLLIAHSASQNKDEKIPCGIGVVINFYVNGIRQNIERAKSLNFDEQDQLVEVLEKDLFQIVLGPEHQAIHHSRSLEITTAYKLQRLSKGFESDLGSIPRLRYCTIDEVLMKHPYAPLQFSSNKYVDFIVRRNLEHILSVCSIPVNLERNTTPMVALTCGDISGHRLTATASFFAFQFLLSAFNYLGNPALDGTDWKTTRAKSSYRDYLRGRIRNTCEWHLNWVFEKAEKPSWQFSKSYWATGEAMKDPQSGEALGDGYLVDTPLQIIKQSDFVTVMTDDSEDDIKISGRRRLEDIIPYWLQTLDETDKRGFSAFPQSGTQQYRLQDHVWIWRALKSIENLDLGTYLRADGPNDEQPIRRQVMNFAFTEDGHMMMSPFRRPLLGNYASDVIQRKALKRFTTENTGPGRRMIAVSRTPAETRFRFYPADSVLLYDSSAPFFDKARPLWKATIESQKFYQENEDSSWESPLCYATALIMSSKGYQISAKSATTMFEEAKRILLRISPPNGLFAGQIDPVTKEPQIFQSKAERDLYWNVSFEIPGILWDYGVQVTKSNRQHGSHVRIPVRPNSAIARIKDYRINGQIEDSYQPNDTSKIERFFPSSTLSNQKDIVELADEWLYNYPDFLDFNPFIWRRFKDIGSLGRCGIETGDLLSRAIRQFKERHIRKRAPFFENNHLKGIVVDVVKTMSKNERRTTRKTWAPLRDGILKDDVHKCDSSPDNFQVHDNRSLYEALDKLRTVEKAKKRLIWLPNADMDTALICFLASPESEKITVSSFFDRHHRREHFLSESAAAASNIWTTEFHLSWYRLHDKCQSKGCQEISFLSTELEIGRAAVGFLFTGDFFDRYWTCRVLEYKPGTKKELQLSETLKRIVNLQCAEQKELRQDLITHYSRILKRAEGFSPPDVKHPWRQRRVLELLLVDFMLSEVSKHHNEMLHEVIEHLTKLFPKSKFPQRGGTPDMWNAFFSSQINTKTYTAFSKHWPPVHCILQILENDLKVILEKVSSWGVRERDREPERPRWTINDERKYRPAITTLLLSNNQRVREIEQHLADIQSLSAYLTGRIECTRNELSLQSAENVRFFTLVTSVFLPLGFATAIFSMNGLPGQSELTGWAILAAVSVFVTFFVLYFGDLDPHILEARGRVEAFFKGQDDEQNGGNDGNDHEGQSKRSHDTASQRTRHRIIAWARQNRRGLEKGKGKERDLEG